MADLKIAEEDPRRPDVVEMLGALDALMYDLYPAESNYPLYVESLIGPETTFLVARIAGQAVGCGALVRQPAGYGEVKRMYVRPEARGQGVAKQLLARIEELARAEGLPCLKLVTGIYQPEAIWLYRRCGYVKAGPFAAYRADRYSVFMEKQLGPPSCGGFD